MIFDSLSIETAPNSPPTWSGTIPFNLHSADQRRVQTSVPLSQVDDKTYEMLGLDLWIDKVSINNESTLSLSGVPNSVRGLVKLSKPAVVSPDRGIFDDSETYQDQEYRFIQAETLGDALVRLFDTVPWEIKIGSEFISSLPVVTEASPVITLNGSLLDQLSSLLNMMSPNDLWGQGLSYFVNYFTGEIFIVTPDGNSTNEIEADINAVRPTEIAISIDYLDKPEKIYAQESEGALFRSPSHAEGYGVKVEPYNHETTKTVTEEDSDKTEISASVSGVRYSVGGLVLTESDQTRITQSTVAEVTYSTGFGTGSSATETTVTDRFITGKTSDTSTAVEYSYVIGPPYVDPVIKPGIFEIKRNVLFTGTLPGTRQQISRDLGCLKINKDNHPSVLLTTDGIRILEKTTVTVQSSSKSFSYKLNDIDFIFPVDISVNKGGYATEDSTTTTMTEVFSYDESGLLVGDRTRKVAQTKEKYVVTESFKTYSPITDQLTSEFSYELSSEYLGGLSSEFLVSSSVTGVSTQVTASPMSGPSPTSVMGGAEEAATLEERLLVNNTAVVDGDVPSGVIYTSVDTLTLDEMSEYVQTYFKIRPSYSYKFSFSSQFIDARGIIGGRFKLVGVESPNRPEAYEVLSTVDGPVIVYQEQQLNRILAAMRLTSFCVAGVSLSWQGETVPSVQMALCQLV